MLEPFAAYGHRGRTGDDVLPGPLLGAAFVSFLLKDGEIDTALVNGIFNLNMYSSRLTTWRCGVCG